MRLTRDTNHFVTAKSYAREKPARRVHITWKIGQHSKLTVMLDKLCEFSPCCKGVKISQSDWIELTVKITRECEKVAILNVISKFDSNPVIMELFS